MHTSELRNGRWKKRRGKRKRRISGRRRKNIFTILEKVQIAKFSKNIFRRTSTTSIERAKEVLYRVLNYICNTIVEDINIFLFKYFYIKLFE